MSDKGGAKQDVHLNDLIQSLDPAIAGGLETLIPWIKAYKKRKLPTHRMRITKGIMFFKSLQTQAIKRMIA